LRKCARSTVGQHRAACRGSAVLLEDDAVTAETVLDDARHAGRKAVWVVEEDIGIELPVRVGWDCDILVELTTCIVVGSQCVSNKCFIVRIASERSYAKLCAVSAGSMPAGGGALTEHSVDDNVTASSDIFGVRGRRRRRTRVNGARRCLNARRRARRDVCGGFLVGGNASYRIHREGACRKVARGWG
jgi:hypothetical protein